MNQPSAELKPCKCTFKQGNEKPYIVSVMGSNWFARCPRCHFGIFEGDKLKSFDEKNEAVQAWNMRVKE